MSEESSRPKTWADVANAAGHPIICACVGCKHPRNCHCFCEECYAEEVPHAESATK